MKTALFLLLAVSTTACQHKSPPAADAPATAVAAAPPPAADAPTDTLAASTKAMLRQYNLAPLWANQTEGPAATHALEGFYGAMPYRISFYFNSVKRDPSQPNLFRVTGLDRYKKVVTPFSGTITVQAIRPFTKEMFADVPDSTARAYTAVGVFELTEDPTAKGAGRYAGQAVLDFYVDANGRLDHALDFVGRGNPTKGCGLLFKGVQVSNATGRRQPVAFANFYGAVVPQALNHLGLGDRSEEVNPNLAKLGWSEAWENDEWWAKPAKPALSL